MREQILGPNLNKAFDLVAQYNRRGMACSLSFLPVIKNRPSMIKNEIHEYLKILSGINARKLDCDVTVKLHQLGIYGSEKLALQSVEQIVAEAQRIGNFVWIDMEQSRTVDATIAIYRELRQKYTSFGICLQAYLKRTERDMRLLLEKKLPLRLVKGFYDKHDFKNWDEVSANYLKLLPYLLEHSLRPAIATHDRQIIESAKQFLKNKKNPAVEFQFFQGVADDEAEKLVREGYKVRIYIPYGNFWRFFARGLKTFDLLHMAERVLGLNPR